MIDGAAWLKQLEAQDPTPVLLPHREAVALARSLAAAQAGAPGARLVAGAGTVRVPD